MFRNSRPGLHLLYSFDIDLARYCCRTFISVERMCKTGYTRKNFSNCRFWCLDFFWFHNRFHGKICKQHKRKRYSKIVIYHRQTDEFSDSIVWILSWISFIQYFMIFLKTAIPIMNFLEKLLQLNFWREIPISDWPFLENRENQIKGKNSS